MANVTPDDVAADDVILTSAHDAGTEANDTDDDDDDDDDVTEPGNDDEGDDDARWIVFTAVLCCGTMVAGILTGINSPLADCTISSM